MSSFVNLSSFGEPANVYYIACVLVYTLTKSQDKLSIWSHVDLVIIFTALLLLYEYAQSEIYRQINHIYIAQQTVAI